LTLGWCQNKIKKSWTGAFWGLIYICWWSYIAGLEIDKEYRKTDIGANIESRDSAVTIF
jgi:hypothetical protein